VGYLDVDKHTVLWTSETDEQCKLLKLKEEPDLDYRPCMMACVLIAISLSLEGA